MWQQSVVFEAWGTNTNVFQAKLCAWGIPADFPETGQPFFTKVEQLCPHE